MFYKWRTTVSMLQRSRSIGGISTNSAKILSKPSLDEVIKKYNEAKKTATTTKDVKEDGWADAPTIYCDGSCIWTERKGGIGIFWSPLDSRNAHLKLTGDKITSIRAELISVSLSLAQTRLIHIYRNNTYRKEDEWESNWNELTEAQRDLCGNFHANQLAQKGINNPMMNDVEFEYFLK
ncbi:unnamed protein product [Dracunculus medinensis]|uniref:RNase H domain-containing protein n=1 Tax=Dracunculus medinensis TaxID=318479 RepID=A0A0N4U1J8_DRAME|nr:unnamed protein product [Dracunculus medinensis]